MLSSNRPVLMSLLPFKHIIFLILRRNLQRSVFLRKPLRRTGIIHMPPMSTGTMERRVQPTSWHWTRMGHQETGQSLDGTKSSHTFCPDQWTLRKWQYLTRTLLDKAEFQLECNCWSAASVLAPFHLWRQGLEVKAFGTKVGKTANMKEKWSEASRWNASVALWGYLSEALSLHAGSPLWP